MARLSLLALAVIAGVWLIMFGVIQLTIANHVRQLPRPVKLGASLLACSRFCSPVHVLAAIFAIGPLVHAATTASRGIRTGDGAATAASARMLRIYSYASVVVVIVGFALMSTTSEYTHKRTADFGETWIWLSLMLWAGAIALVFAVELPALRRAGDLIASGGSGNAASLVGRVAAAGGIVGLIFAAIIFLMVYRP